MGPRPPVRLRLGQGMRRIAKCHQLPELLVDRVVDKPDRVRREQLVDPLPVVLSLRAENLWLPCSRLGGSVDHRPGDGGQLRVVWRPGPRRCLPLEPDVSVGTYEWRVEPP